MAKPTAADFSELTSAISSLNTTIASRGTGGTGSPLAAVPTRTATRTVSALSELGNKLENLGNKLEKFTNSLNKTQKDFGVSIAAAARLQVNAFKESINSFINTFKALNFSQIFSGIKEIVSIAGSEGFNAIKALTSGNIPGFKNAISSVVSKISETLNRPLGGKGVSQPLMPEETLAATKAFQDEFGVINQEIGRQIAQEAKDRGLSVEQLVQSRRAFATIAMGDLNKVADIQTRFFDQFKSKGLTPKVALEAITKYAELIARNGTRFADSFARAAADAKKIGVDLSKVDQIGDNIVDDFEGFLESQAALGAMGFGFDSSRLAEIAATGSTEALFTELRSQLAATGKDITKLSRPERLELEKAFGINISDMLKLAGLTPEGTAKNYDEDNNSLLNQLLIAVTLLSPLLLGISAILATISTFLGPGSGALGVLGSIATALGASAGVAAIAYLGVIAGKKGEELRKQGAQKIAQGKTAEGLKESAAGGALEGTVGGLATAGAALGLAYLLGTPPGWVTSILALSAGAFMGAAGGSMIGMSSAFQEGRAQRYGPLKETEQKRKEEQSQINKQMMGFVPLPGTTQTTPQYNPSVVNPFATPVKKAEGGLVTGTGTSKSDSIPARLSNGEYVLNAKAVSLLGKDTLDRFNNVQKFADGGLVGTLKGFTQNKGLGNLISGIEKLGYFGDKLSTSVEKISSESGILGKFKSLGNMFGEQMAVIKTKWGGLRSKASDVGGWLGDKKEGAMKWIGGKQEGISKWLGGKKEGAMGWLGGKQEGTMKWLGGKASKMAGSTLGKTAIKWGSKLNKLPGGLGGMFNAGSALSSGKGIGGAVTAVGSSAAGRMIGGAVGSLIPIPGVGTAVGMLAGNYIGKGVGKLVQSKPVRNLAKYSGFGLATSGISKLAKSKIASTVGIGAVGAGIGKLLGKKKPQAVPAGMDSVPSPDLSMMVGPQRSQEPMIIEQKPATVDTSGIEQKLNNFINALQNIQINMDGNKVGKVLVNTSDSAAIAGVFRTQAR